MLFSIGCLPSTLRENLHFQLGKQCLHHSEKTFIQMKDCSFQLWPCPLCSRHGSPLLSHKGKAYFSGTCRNSGTILQIYWDMQRWQVQVNMFETVVIWAPYNLGTRVVLEASVGRDLKCLVLAWREFSWPWNSLPVLTQGNLGIREGSKQLGCQTARPPTT